MIESWLELLCLMYEGCLEVCPVPSIWVEIKVKVDNDLCSRVGAGDISCKLNQFLRRKCNEWWMGKKENSVNSSGKNTTTIVIKTKRSSSWTLVVSPKINRNISLLHHHLGYTQNKFISSQSSHRNLYPHKNYLNS